MKDKTLFITTASWEPRFSEGVREVLSEKEFSSVLCYWFKEYAPRTQEVRDGMKDLCGSSTYKDLPLQFFSDEKDGASLPAHAATWKAIYLELGDLLPGMSSFVLDISTMPREVIWITLDILSEAGMSGDIIYHRAKSHGDWCGCEPERPHIVPKLGGVPSVSRQSKLLIVSGYDEDRSEQFIATYEPVQTLILCQHGVSDQNVEQNEKKHKLRLAGRGNSILFESVDCYAQDWGYSRILEAALSFAGNDNLILASLGPKTSAVALYRVHQEISESSLVYAPCRNYNSEYSDGKVDTLSLRWNSGEGSNQEA